MNKAFSLYLDFIRFVAAFAVLVHHMVSFPFTDNVIWARLGEYGTTAVTIFFVLSGYVIAYVTSTSEKSAPEYAVARISRLYSVAVIALVLTFALDRIGLAINPEFYLDDKVLRKPESWSGYISSALFLNEYQIFRFNGISPGTNAPFWSLSFEVTYYAIAGFALFARRSLFVLATAVILGSAGRTVAAMLPLWCLGFWLYHMRLALSLPKVVWAALTILSAAAVIFTPEWEWRLPTHNFGVWFPWGRGPFNRNVVDDYAVAFVFAAHLLSAKNLLAFEVAKYERVTKVVRWLGSLTFPLYCLHYPAICFLGAVSPWAKNTLANAAFITVCTFAMVVALTPLCEFLKRLLRAWANSWFTKLPRHAQAVSSGTK